MRIALISDLHANEVALHAVLSDIDRVGADQVVCLGDVATLGPHPSAVIQTLRDLGCPCILGNHDAFLLEPDLIHTYTELPIIVAAVDWCRGRVSADDLAFLATFQPSLRFAVGDSSVLLYHGSPRSHMEDILATTPPDELDRFLTGQNATVMAGGHTHIQMLRQHRGTLIVNPGSVGLPFREFVGGQAPTLLDHAEYAMVEVGGDGVSVQLRRVPLRKERLRQAVLASDIPLREWLLAQYA